MWRDRHLQDCLTWWVVLVPCMIFGCQEPMRISPNQSPTGQKVTQYARFQAGSTISYGIVEGDRVRQIDGDLFGQWRRTDKTYDLDGVKLLVPTTPTKILAMAGNYKSHLHDQPMPKNPELFLKPPSCLIPAGADIVIPRGAEPVHYEAELVIVIGKRAEKVPKDKALDYVLGVTCGNDVSARDWQANDKQWWRAKGSDTFGPCGPFIVSGINYDNLLLQLRLNGQVKQEQRTKDLIYGVADIISFASRHMTLEPGDLIYTGTPGTTGPMKPGDIIEVEIENVGVLRNGVTAAK
ncbi:MAG TPA: fumarylacetoacetate hydrolase family protein [Phycisphaerae bacterium]|nr:fumarylacetoacetate hydrolase family protein [Phycisphaerae bacterium]